MSYTRRALSGSSTVIPRYRRPRVSLGSLGDDTSGAGSTLSQPTIADPATLQWQSDIRTQLQTGVMALQGAIRKAEFQKWVQILATLSIPLSAFVWRQLAPRLFKRDDTGA